MATSGTIIERFASGAGYLPSTVERMLRPLRAAGLVPMGEKGRGQRVGHYDAVHLSNLILACGGVQPVDSAEAASALSSVPFAGSGVVKPNSEHVKEQPSNALYMPKKNVQQALEHMITGAAHVHHVHAVYPSNMDAAFDFEEQLIPNTIELTLVPLMVHMHWYKYDNNSRTDYISRTDYYRHNGLSSSALDLRILRSNNVRRTIYIHAGLIRLAGELLYDNPSWEPTLPLPFLASAVPNAGQKVENTGPVPTSPVPDSDQATLPRDPDGATRSEHGGVREKSQPSRQRGKVTQPVIRRENRHADTQDSAYLFAP